MSKLMLHQYLEFVEKRKIVKQQLAKMMGINTHLNLLNKK